MLGVDLLIDESKGLGLRLLPCAASSRPNGTLRHQARRIGRLDALPLVRRDGEAKESGVGPFCRAWIRSRTTVPSMKAPRIAACGRKRSSRVEARNEGALDAESPKRRPSLPRSLCSKREQSGGASPPHPATCCCTEIGSQQTTVFESSDRVVNIIDYFYVQGINSNYAKIDRNQIC